MMESPPRTTWLRNLNAKSRTRWIRRCVLAAALLSVAYALREQWLPLVARVLIFDQAASPGDVVLILDEGERRFDVAAELTGGDATRILLYVREPNRLERMGIRPTPEALGRRECSKRGFAGAEIAALAEAPIGKSHAVERLHEWLLQYPDKSVGVLCDRFDTRTWALLVHRACDDETRDRVRVVALPHRKYDETNWWHSKDGQRALMNGYLVLAYHLLHRGPEPECRECSPAELRQSVLGDKIP
jgi:hypothetical protein